MSVLVFCCCFLSLFFYIYIFLTKAARKVHVLLISSCFPACLKGNSTELGNST